MSSTTPLFVHRWATRICRKNPLHRRSANRIIEITVTQDELCSRVMVPFLRFGFPDIHIPLTKIVQSKNSTFSGFPTILVTYRTANDVIESLEHAFTTLLPFPLVTNAGEAFLQALEAAGYGKAETNVDL